MIDLSYGFVVICDLDGTLSDSSHRQHFMQGSKKDWESFYNALSEDPVCLAVAETIAALANFCNTIVFFTGRPEKYREKTLKWFKDKNMEFWPQFLYMRKDGDFRPDYVVKEEMLNSFLMEHKLTKDNIILALDDRDQVVHLWRNLGITCFQVKEGNF